MIFIDLVHNLSLLVALTAISGFTGNFRKNRRSENFVIQGILFGSVAVIGMLKPFILSSGLIFDGRSVIISLCGFFFGAVPAVIASLMAVVCRIFIGGVGVPVGICVIAASAVTGIVFHQFKKQNNSFTSAWIFLVFGLIVSVIMLFMMLGLPGDLAINTIKRLYAPVLIIYPFATVLIGKILSDQEIRSDSINAIKASEEKYRRIIETANEGIWVTDSDFSISYVNARMCEMLGYTQKEMTGQKIDFFMSAEDYISYCNKMAAYAKNGDDAVHECRLKKKSGEAIWTIVSTSSANDKKSDGIMVFAMFTDITTRKAAEDALKENEKRLRAIIDNSPVGLGLSRDGITVDANPVYLKMFGFENIEEIRNTPLIDQIAPHCRNDVLDKIKKRSLGLEVEKTYECAGIRKDGSEFPFMASANRIELQDGPLTIAFFSDLTDTKLVEKEKIEMERRLLHTQKLESLGVLAGGIAHDFNNLLMAILGHADIALMELSPVSHIRPQLQEIITASRRAADLCRQMLAYSGKGIFVIERIAIRSVIDEMLNLLKTCISKKALLNLNLEKNLPQIKGDPGQIRQLLMNLVINASEAIDEKSGVITISTGVKYCDRQYLGETFFDENLQEGLYVSIEVSDTGCGMDAETQARIFEPFFTTKFTGRGLGMSAVLGIVRGHKGAIRIYSEIEKGTTFRVLFPAVDACDEELEQQKKKSGISVHGEGTVLLVDDEEAVLGVGIQMLERLGFSVVTARDGVEAVDIYKNRQVDFVFVLIDLTMPRMNGEEAFREFRQLDPDLPVIISSGYSEQEIASRFTGKKLAGFIQKPYQLASLQEVIEKVLKYKDAAS